MRCIDKFREELSHLKFIFIGNYDGFKEMNYYKLLPNVTFTGVLKRADVLNHYASARLNILISHDEGFGMSVLEAANYGVPSIINQEMELSSLLSKERSVGMISDVEDLDLLRDKILEFMSKDFTLMDFKFVDHFSESSIINKYERCLEGFCDSRTA